MAKSKTHNNGAAQANAEGLPKVNHPIFKQYGQAAYLDGKKWVFNQNALVRKFVADENIGIDIVGDMLLRYSPQTGAWQPLTSPASKLMLSEAVRSTAAQYGQAELPYRTKPSFLTSLEQMARVVAPVVKTTAEPGMSLVSNGVLDLTEKPVVKAFARDYGFTSGSPLAYNNKAECPRFLNELLGSALAKDDISLIQRYFGSVLLGPNTSHRILLLKGTAGGGKSTLVSLLERVIGYDRVAYLRSNHLAGRFEFGGFLGKRLLTGKDVPGDALSVNGAKLLKSLVGGDLLEGEIKYVAEKKQLVGDFHVVIACNNNLLIAPDEDPDAWRRRLLVIEFNRPKPTTPIPDLADKLYREEGEGILAWLVEGAVQYRRELKKIGNVELTKEQQARIDDLIDASRSVECFVRKGVRSNAGGQATVQGLVEGYQSYCKQRKWMPLTERQVENQLANLMLSIHGVARRNDLQIDGQKSRVRGFKGVSLVA